MIKSGKMLRNQSAEVRAMMSSQQINNNPKVITGENAPGISTRVVPMYI